MSKPQLKTQPSSNSTLSSFLEKAITTAIQKQRAAFTRMQAKLSDNQQPPRQDPSRDPSLTSKGRTTSLAKVKEQKGRARSELGKQDEARLNQLVQRKQQLMERLRKIDYQLRNPSLLPVTIQMSGSRVPLDLPLRQADSRAMIQQQQAYNPSQHEKTLEMLGRLNNEKLRRHEKIVDSMKRKQQLEMDKLVQIQSDKSHLAKPKAKHNPFNNPQRQEFSRQSKHQTTSQRQQIATNQFQELPELITASNEQKVDSFSQL